MNSKFLLAAFSAAVFTTTSAFGSDVCDEFGQVSGWVRTANLSETLQSGLIKLVVKADGETYFKRRGIIVGEIVAQGFDEYGRPISTLEHNMFFGRGTRFETFNDQAVLTPTGKTENGIPCEFAVTELIADAVGTRKLRAISNDMHEVVAEGTVSFCSDNNHNELTLSGTVCFD